MSIADGESPISTPLTLFLIQLLLVGVFSKLLARGFKYIKQPTVIAEVVTGIILGKSALGKVNGYMDKLFPQESLTTFNVIANFGLILFMFLVGLELDTKLMKKNVGNALIISISAMAAPFILGLGSSYIIYKTVADEGVSFASFLLFVAVAMSITAFPVLARILTEMQIIHTKVGSLALSAAAVDDVTAWCLLALVVAIAKAKSKLDGLWTFLMLLGFLLVMMLVVRPLLSSWAKRRTPGANARFTVVVILLFGIFFCSWITEIIGVHAIFGAFILGVIVPRQNQFAQALTERIEDLVVVVLLPFYFTYSGLRTDIGSLRDAKSWGLVVLVCTTACVGKILGGTLSARFVKSTWRESFTIGILLNTKGLVELIVLNVGLDVGVLNTEIFTIFVLMALFTTFLTTPILHFVYIRHLPKLQEQTSIEEYSVLAPIRVSKFASSLVTLCKLFSGLKHSVSCKVLLLNEISDRPSSYFYSEFTRVFQKSDKGIISAAKSGAFQKVRVESKPLSSANLEKDVVEYAVDHKHDIVLFATNIGIDDTSGREKKNCKHDVSAVGIDVGVGKTFNSLMEDQVIKQSLRNLKCPIGVYVQKIENGIEFIHKIAFMYSGVQHEHEALNIVSSIPHKVLLTIITTVPDINTFAARENFTLKVVSNVQEYIQSEEAEKESFDLVILGANRNSNVDFESPVVQRSKFPVLLIYTGAEQPFNLRQSSTLTKPIPKGKESLLRSKDEDAVSITIEENGGKIGNRDEVELP